MTRMVLRSLLLDRYYPNICKSEMALFLTYYRWCLLRYVHFPSVMLTQECWYSNGFACTRCFEYSDWFRLWGHTASNSLEICKSFVQTILCLNSMCCRMSVGFVAIAIQCVLLLTLSTHWCACIWYLIACPSGECKSGTWADSLGTYTAIYMHMLGKHLDSLTMWNILCIFTSNTGITNSTEYHYLTSLYWSVTTLTTTGYGEISATNKLEMIVSSCIMIIGKLMFGYILGNVASEISNWSKNQVEFKGKVAAVKVCVFISLHSWYYVVLFASRNTWIKRKFLQACRHMSWST